MSQETTAAPVDPRTQRLIDVQADFERNTTDHVLEVLMDQSTDPDNPQPYRHLRIKAPGTNIYAYDIITWPGHLATAGDIADGYMFARERDMVDFFAPSPGKSTQHRINPEYWSEKLAFNQRTTTRSFEKNYACALILHEVRESEALSTWQPRHRELLLTSLEDHIDNCLESTANGLWSHLTSWESGGIYDEYCLERDIALHNYNHPDDLIPSVDDGDTNDEENNSPKSFDMFQDISDVSEIVDMAEIEGYHLLLAMHAIVHGLDLYRKHLAR